MMTTETHVTRAWRVEGITASKTRPPHGLYVHGVYVQGARWSSADDAVTEETAHTVAGVDCAGCLLESKLKELLPAVPVMYVTHLLRQPLPSITYQLPPPRYLRAVPVKPEWVPSSVGYLRPETDIYDAPVFFHAGRGPTWVCLATLTSREPGSKWVLAAVCLLFQTN